MNKKETNLEKAINSFIIKEYPSESENENIKKLVYDDLYIKISNEIFEEKKEEIKKAAKKEIDQEQIKEKFNNWCYGIILGSILSLMLGLLTNQVTDLVTYFKDRILFYTKPTWTIIGIFILFLSLGVMYFLGIHKFIEEVIEGKSKEDNNGNQL